MPLIVLTAGHPQRLPLISDSANTAIQINQPMAVVDAVRDVLDAARRRDANSRP